MNTDNSFSEFYTESASKLYIKSQRDLKKRRGVAAIAYCNNGF